MIVIEPRKESLPGEETGVEELHDLWRGAVELGFVHTVVSNRREV
jgi:hypothetical protein